VCILRIRNQDFPFGSVSLLPPPPLPLGQSDPRERTREAHSLHMPTTPPPVPLHPHPRSSAHLVFAPLASACQPARALPPLKRPPVRQASSSLHTNPHHYSPTRPRRILPAQPWPSPLAPQSHPQQHRRGKIVLRCPPALSSPFFSVPPVGYISPVPYEFILELSVQRLRIW
jgi:hypothetical protein